MFAIVNRSEIDRETTLRWSGRHGYLPGRLRRRDGCQQPGCKVICAWWNWIFSHIDGYGACGYLGGGPDLIEFKCPDLLTVEVCTLLDAKHMWEPINNVKCL